MRGGCSNPASAAERWARSRLLPSVPCGLSSPPKKVSGVAGGLRRQKIFQALAESETGASRNFIRSHAGDELVRRVEIELSLIEHVDVVLERSDLQSVEIDGD